MRQLKARIVIETRKGECSRSYRVNCLQLGYSTKAWQEWDSLFSDVRFVLREIAKADQKTSVRRVFHIVPSSPGFYLFSSNQVCEMTTFVKQDLRS